MIGGNLLRILVIDIKEETNKQSKLCRTGDIYADPFTMGTALKLDETGKRGYKLKKT